MRNPLNKRVFRELKKDWMKYLALLLLMSLFIGFVSGMLVANGSMLAAAKEAYTKYNIEHGHFDLDEAPSETLLKAIEKEGVRLVEQSYKQLPEDKDNDGTAEGEVRVFPVREDMNLICLMFGRLPVRDNEIVIDRMHANNQSIQIGDRIKVGRKMLTVTGLVAFSDYSTLYENNSDMMFNALTFDVAAMTPSGYRNLEGETHYQYAFQYLNPPENDEEQKVLADQLVERLAVLSATGGLHTDKDEAEAWADQITEWADYLESLEEQAEDLQARADQFRERLSSLSLEEQFLQAAALQKEADDLEEEQERLESLADEAQPLIDQLEEWDIYLDGRNELTDFVPEYANQAVHFAPNDFGSDKAMGEVLLVLFIAVLAFIFAITTNSTIQKEAPVIGTLRASGYSRLEMLLHYMSTPIVVTLLAATIGNILGYTLLKDVVVSLYYNSYSLPTYVTRWNPNAFVETTLFPVALVTVINFFLIASALRFSPLRFLRGDLSSHRNHRAVSLPDWRFFQRFRMRIFLQNLSGYITLFVGVLFVMVLLFFSVGMPSTLHQYQRNAKNMIVAPYQTVLKFTEDEDGNRLVPTNDAELFAMQTLDTTQTGFRSEGITVYGYQPDSTYLPFPDDLPKGTVYASYAYMDKYRLSLGDTIVLKEPYGSKTYSFTVGGSYKMSGILSIAMPQANLNELFEQERDAFTGYFSQEPLTGIEEGDIATVVTVEDAVSMANQLDHSIGQILFYFSFACMGIAMLLMFLLTKNMIERNSTSISMVKVLGYNNREINQLYVTLTSIVVVVSAFITMPLSFSIVRALWNKIMTRMPGWILFEMQPADYVRCVLMLLISYFLVSIIDMGRIKRIPLAEALKNVE